MRYNKEILENVLSDFIYASSYWCFSAEAIFPEKNPKKEKYGDITEKLIDCLEKGGYIKIHTEDGNFRMNLKSLCHGIAMARKKFGHPDDWDGVITDMAIQYAVFNELVYG